MENHEVIQSLIVLTHVLRWPFRKALWFQWIPTGVLLGGKCDGHFFFFFYMAFDFKPLFRYEL